MFFHQKRTLWPLYLFGGIALLIVIATGWLLLATLNAKDRQTAIVTQTSPKNVVSDYQELVEQLVEKVETSPSSAMLATDTETALLGARVPHQLLDAHLTAIRSLHTLSTETGDTKNGLVQILETLQQQANAL